jgi:hypothetical protein
MSTPAAPAPRNFAAEMAQMSGMAQQFAANQSKQALATNQGMINQALSATDTISGRLGDDSWSQYNQSLRAAIGNLPARVRINGKNVNRNQLIQQFEAGTLNLQTLPTNLQEQISNAVGPVPRNTFTDRAAGQIDAAMGQIPGMATAADEVRGLAGIARDSVGGTNIERELQRQAEADLAAGRSLTAEQERSAQQSVRSAMSARGLAVGNPAAIGEVLMRDAYATEREGQRRAFAGNVNQMLTSNQQSRLGLAGNLYGQESGMRQNTAAMGLAGAQGYIGTDPYQRALGSNIPIASQGAATSLANNAYGQVLAYGSDLYNTNLNMQASQYNSYMNNRSALQGAGMYAGAQRQAGNSAMTGAVAGASIAAVGTIGAAVII